MRVLTTIIAIVSASSTVSADPKLFDCGPGGGPNPSRSGCLCPPGKKPDTKHDATTELLMAICVVPQRPPPPRVLQPARLLQPADGARDIDEKTDFAVDVPSWATDVEIDICPDPSCTTMTRAVNLSSVSRGPAHFRLESPARGETLYWRARTLGNGNVRDSDVRRFTVAAAKVTAPAAPVDDRPESTRSAAKHLALAKAAQGAGKCDEVLRIYALPRDADPAATPDLDQLAKSCRISTTNTAIIAAVDAKDFDKASQLSKTFQETAAADEVLAISWGDAYRAAKDPSVACSAAQTFLDVAKGSIAPDPGNVADTVGAVCKSRQTHPDNVSIYADSFYDFPLSGVLTARGLGFAAGVRGHIGEDTKAQNVSIGAGIFTVRPHADGIDNRIGSFWGLEFHLDAGMDEPSPFSLRFDFRAQWGTGHFQPDPGETHDLFIVDAIPGLSMKVRLASWLRLALRGGMHFGFAVDRDPQVDTGLDGFRERWHGTIGYDIGLMFDTYFTSTR